jgi:DNA-binding IclR family transcriptional regulator
MDKAVVKAFGLLEILAQSGKPLGVTDLAKQSELGKSNVHRLLQTLQSLDYVKKSDDSHYTASLRLWEMGSQIISRVSIRGVANPFMQILAETTSETVHLSELHEGEVLYVDKIESREPVRAYTQLGGRAPAYCTATGKSMLAYQSEDTIRKVMADAHAHTAKTLATTDSFLAEAKVIRAQRFAVNRGEWRPDIIGIAAPICCAAGHVEAALGLSAPASRTNEAELVKLAPQLIGYVEKISQAIGCSPKIWANLGQQDV